MSYFRIPKGSNLALNVLLADGNISKFPLAYVYKEDFTQVAGSPFVLSSVGNGLYSNLTVSVPEGRYVAVAVVYNDVGHTQVSPTYGRSMDVFDVTDIVDVNAISEGVWRETLAGNVPAGSFGESLAAIGAQAGNVAAAKTNTDTLISRLTAGRASNLDNLNAPVADIPAGVWDVARAAHTAAGTFGEALDAPISSRESETAAVSRALIDEAQHAATQEAISDLNGNLSVVSGNVIAIRSKTDILSFSSGQVIARAATVGDKTGYALSSAADASVATATWATNLGGQAAGQLLQDAATSNDPAVIANAVWDESRATHTADGSFGEALQGILSNARASNLDNLDIPVSSRQSTIVAASQYADLMVEHSDTQSAVSIVGSAVGTVITNVNAVKSDTSKIGTPTVGTIASNLDAARAQIIAVQADTDDIQARIGTPFGASLVADVQTNKLLIQGVKAKTDQLTFTGTNVNARTKVLDDKSGVTLDGAQITSIIDGVWDESIASHTAPGTAGEALAIAAAGTNPTAVADAVWDEMTSAHVIGGSFGNLMAGIRHAEMDIMNELTDSTYGLDKIHLAVINEAAATRAEVNVNETKIDAIIPAVVASGSSVSSDVLVVGGQVAALSGQLGTTKNEIIAEVNQNEVKIDALAGTVSTLTNNTTARFIVPERMILPTSGTKDYMFYLRLFDEHGVPENADSLPDIIVRDVNSDLIVNTGTMSAEFGRTGCYECQFTVNSSMTPAPLMVEVAFVKGGVTRYLPAVSEITEFESDLTGLSAQVSTLDAKVSTTNVQLNSGVYGLAALKAGQGSIGAGIASIEADLGILSSEVQAIPTDTATSLELAAVAASLAAKPSVAQVQGIVDNARSAIQGIDVRDLTQVYDNMDLSMVAKTNDPRFNNLDAPVSSRSTLTAPQVWAHGSRSLTEHDPLSASDVEGIWGYLTSQVVTPNSIGKLLTDLVDAPVSSRATAADVSGFLSGVAQESTVSGVASQVSTLSADTAIRDAQTALILSHVLAKANLLPSDPASQSAVIAAINATVLALNNIDLKATAIRAKTDNLPANPAQESSVYAAAAPLLRADDVRLNKLANLDQPVSSVVPADISALAKTVDLHAAHTEIVDKVLDNYAEIINTKLLASQIKVTTDSLPTGIARASDVVSARNDIIARIDAEPAGLTAADVWGYGARTITQDPQSFGPDISGLATAADLAGLAPDQYTADMSTVFNPVNGKQEVIVWAEKNGVLATGTACQVIVKDSLGTTKWQASMSGPNSDGLYRFENPLSVPMSQNYYIVIEVEVDGQVRTAVRAFYTVV